MGQGIAQEVLKDAQDATAITIEGEVYRSAAGEVELESNSPSAGQGLQPTASTRGELARQDWLGCEFILALGQPCGQERG